MSKNGGSEGMQIFCEWTILSLFNSSKYSRVQVFQFDECDEDEDCLEDSWGHAQAGHAGQPMLFHYVYQDHGGH